MESHEEIASPALAELTRRGRDAPRPPSSAELSQGLDVLRSGMAGRARRSALLRRSALGAVAVACLVVALKVWSGTSQPAPEPPVSVARVEGGQILEGGYLSQSGGSGVALSFNEGSRFELTSGTRARLRAVTAKEVQLAIENGEASLQVTPSRDRHWLVEAGPFLVTVKGTAFTVSWDQSSERFELTLRHGRVVVSGPIVDGAIALRAGQRLVVSLPRAETLITDVPPGRANVAPAAAPPAADAVPVSRPPGARGPSSRSESSSRAAPLSSTRAARRWSAALARGHWDEILADAERVGVDATLAEAASEDLFALADAARYRRRAELARAALLAQRRRFPRSPRAMDAVFFLGRAEELREQGAARAITWYEEYLTGAPGGAYAAEALGRKMILTNELGGSEKARAIARQYLLRFPDGSYAGSARALQRVP